MKFRLNFLFLFIFLLAGCASSGKPDIKIDVPDIDSNGYNDPLFTKGWNNLRAGEVEKAYENFRDSSSLNDKLYTGFGYVYLFKKKYKLAQRNFLKALELNSENVNAAIGLATIDEIFGRIFKAFATYSKLFIKFPNNSWVKIRYEFIKSSQTLKFLSEAEKEEQKGRNDISLLNLKKASYFSPEVLNIKIRIAKKLSETGNYEEAAIYFESALENSPNDIGILKLLAENYIKANHLDSAIIVYRKIKNLDPEDSDISKKINDLKIKFHELDLPVKFKDIFFKDSVNREEFAALISHYFKNYIIMKGQPVIITDISTSFVKSVIIKLCSEGIMKVMPDHTFRGKNLITRTSYIIILNSLIEYLQKNGYIIKYTPNSSPKRPSDITPVHKYFNIITFLSNAGIIKLDEGDKFNGSRTIKPSELLYSLRKIVKDLEKR